MTMRTAMALAMLPCWRWPACRHARQDADWMPGSGAMKVNLTGAEEVPPAKTAAKGSGSFRVAEDGTITGSVTTEA